MQQVLMLVDDFHQQRKESLFVIRIGLIKRTCYWKMAKNYQLQLSRRKVCNNVHTLLLASIHIVTLLQEAKAVLHSSTPSTLLCREKEIESLKTFLETHLERHVPGSLYISGPPGTGKTATLTHILSHEKVCNNIL